MLSMDARKVIVAACCRGVAMSAVMGSEDAWFQWDDEAWAAENDVTVLICSALANGTDNQTV